MKSVFIRCASVEDAVSIATRLRPEDRDEIIACCGIDPRVVLPAYVEEGREVYVSGLAFDQVPEMIFGTDPIPGDPEGATIWFLSTPRIYEFPVEFTVNTKKVFELYHDRYPFLTNFMDARNTKHLKLIKWLGFHPIRRVESFGAQSRPFIEFASYKPKEADTCSS